VLDHPPAEGIEERFHAVWLVFRLIDLPHRQVSESRQAVYARVEARAQIDYSVDFVGRFDQLFVDIALPARP
jgi:hypothetical protein